MTLRVWRYGPGHEMAYHRHQDQEELYQLLSGGPQEVFVEGEVVTVQDGEWLRFPKDTAAPDPEPQRPRGRVAHHRRARPASASATASASTPTRARRSPARDAGRRERAPPGPLAGAARPQAGRRGGQDAPARRRRRGWPTRPTRPPSRRSWSSSRGSPRRPAAPPGGSAPGWPARSSAAVSVAAWERDLMSLRYEIADMAPGPMRDAAINAYVAQASAGVHLIATPGRPETRPARGDAARSRPSSGCWRRERLTRRRAAPDRRRRRGRPGRLRRARRDARQVAMSELGRDRLRRLVRRPRGGGADRRAGARDRPARDRRRRDVGVGRAPGLPRASRPARLRGPGAPGHLAPHPPPQPADALLRLRHLRLPAAVRDDVRPLGRRVPARPDHRGGGGGRPHDRRDVRGADRHRGRRVADVGAQGVAAPGAAAAQELRRGGAPAVPGRGPALLGRPEQRRTRRFCWTFPAGDHVRAGLAHYDGHSSLSGDLTGFLDRHALGEAGHSTAASSPRA